jgi:2-dehydropantoate 2-reductase
VKIAVVGVGAMGSVYSGLLGSAGNEVWALDVWAEHVDAIRSTGLRVEGASGERVVCINATTDPTDVGVTELVVIATKAMDVEAAARAARHLLDAETAVITIQNGVGSAERAASILGADRVVVGVAGGFGASMIAPGHVHHHGLELIRFAELEGPATPRIDRIAEVWRRAGFKVRTCDDAGRLVWEKLICNVGFSGTCALLELTVGEVIADPAAWWVAARCAEEAFAVARARGISLEIGDAPSYVRAFGEKIPGARPSMLLDLLAARRCEVDVINGAVSVAARELGLEAPVNETVSALVKAKESRILGVASEQSD